MANENRTCSIYFKELKTRKKKKYVQDAQSKDSMALTLSLVHLRPTHNDDAALFFKK